MFKVVHHQWHMGGADLHMLAMLLLVVQAMQSVDSYKLALCRNF
jgi:hypothetical protein